MKTASYPSFVKAFFEINLKSAIKVLDAALFFRSKNYRVYEWIEKNDDAKR